MAGRPKRRAQIRSNPRTSLVTLDALLVNPLTDAERDRVYGAARGSYQQDVMRGWRNWSGSDLKGKARDYSGKYHKSRASLLASIRKSLPPGWEAKVEAINKHGKLGLVLYDPEGARHEW